MVDQIMFILNSAFVACSDWFVKVWLATDVSTLYFVFIFIYLAIRFILTPIVGKVTSGSDKARKTGNSEEDSDG